MEKKRIRGGGADITSISQPDVKSLGDTSRLKGGGGWGRKGGESEGGRRRGGGRETEKGGEGGRKEGGEKGVGGGSLVQSFPSNLEGLACTGEDLT